MVNEQSTIRERDGSSCSGPENVLDALKAFKEAQDRRVAHWKEYDEALEHYERTNLYADNAEGTQETEFSAQRPQAHRCGSQPSHGQGQAASSSHYQSVALPMTDAIFTKVLALVTSGLLDCSHAVRAVEIELRSTFQREDLARLVGRVQENENGVLRAIVHRDQTKRIAKVEGRELAESIAQSNREILDLRERIQEAMSEVNAEMADL